MRYKYCPNCGTNLTEIKAGDEGMVPYCEPCKKMWYDTFATCVIVLTYNEFGEVVLQRQGYLSTEYSTLTSGYIAPGENAAYAVYREFMKRYGGSVHGFKK